MRIVSCVATLIALQMAAPFSSHALDYFPAEPGPIYTYENGWVTLRNQYPGEISRELHEGYLTTHTYIYTQDENGDIRFRGVQSYCETTPCLVNYMCAPQVLYLDFPLETGKTWSSTATEVWLVTGSLRRVIVTGTVIGPRTVTVPAGEFEVIVVSLSYSYSDNPALDHTEELWLHRQLGPVNMLVSWTGVVGVEDTTWGSVKAQFR